MADAFMQSTRLLADALRSFTEHCVVGIEPRRGNIAARVERSRMQATALTPVIDVIREGARIATRRSGTVS